MSVGRPPSRRARSVSELMVGDHQRPHLREQVRRHAGFVVDAERRPQAMAQPALRAGEAVSGHHLGRRRRGYGAAVIGDHLDLVVGGFDADGVHAGDVGPEHPGLVERRRPRLALGHMDGDAYAESRGRGGCRRSWARRWWAIRARQWRALRSWSSADAKYCCLDPLDVGGAALDRARLRIGARRTPTIAVGEHGAHSGIGEPVDRGVGMRRRVHDVRPVEHAW